MDLNLKDFQIDCHEKVLILQKIHNFIYKDSLNKMGTPEGPYILTELYQAIMSYRVNKPKDQPNCNSEKFSQVLGESIDYLNYVNKETKADSKKEKIGLLILEISNFNQLK